MLASRRRTVGQRRCGILDLVAALGGVDVRGQHALHVEPGHLRPAGRAARCVVLARGQRRFRRPGLSACSRAGGGARARRHPLQAGAARRLAAPPAASSTHLCARAVGPGDDAVAHHAVAQAKAEQGRQQWGARVRAARRRQARGGTARHRSPQHERKRERLPPAAPLPARSPDPALGLAGQADTQARAVGAIRLQGGVHLQVRVAVGGREGLLHVAGIKRVLLAGHRQAGRAAGGLRAVVRVVRARWERREMRCARAGPPARRPSARERRRPGGGRAAARPPAHVHQRGGPQARCMASAALPDVAGWRGGRPANLRAPSRGPGSWRRTRLHWRPGAAACHQGHR